MVNSKKKGVATGVMGAVALDYAAPDAGLRDFVSVFYDFRADVPVFEDLERADLAQFRFKLAGGPALYEFADGHVQDGPEIQIVGPTTGTTRSRVEGPVHVFGCGLLPAGWGALLGLEASTLVNRVIDAAEFFGERVVTAAADLRAADGIEARVAIGNALIRDLAAQSHSQPLWFTRLVDSWLESDLSPEIDDLVSATRLSRRQVERYCKRFYGAPPKVLARKYRALRAAVALARGEDDMDHLLEQGFYDQSHFIREIKAFTGVTPKKIALDLPVLTRLTLKRGELAGVAPLVGET